MSTVTDQSKVYEAFKSYPWETDKMFQEGLEYILAAFPVEDDDQREKDKVNLEQDARLLQAKHFYFTRFQQKFDLEEYLKYEAEKLKEKADAKQEELFNLIENYNYDNDVNYTNGLPSVIHAWLEQQAKTGLWDKEKLELEFLKSKAFYFNARIQSIDLESYFNWKAKKDQANAPVCPFANLWQNKSKIGPVDQVNGSTFVMIEKPKGTGAETLTLSSPKSQNVYSVSRLKEYMSAIKDGQSDDRVTSLFITATVADSSNLLDMTELIETKDTKVISSGLAYDETSRLVSGSDSRQVSLEKLAFEYYHLVRYLTGQRKDPKLIITFSNGQIPLNAVYLTLGLGFMRVITEYSLLDFTLSLSHAPIPPLLLLYLARVRTNAAAKPLPNGLEMYLALAAPEYAKLRGPEILRLCLADVFVPEAKLSDAFEMAKKMAVCPGSDTNAAIQLALAIHHTYAGPNRLQVWQDNIEKVFGAAESFDDLKSRLEEIDSTWSKTILNYWSTLPPVLLRVIYKAVILCKDKPPSDILELEQKLNAKWRQTEDYREWLDSKNEWLCEESPVDAMVEFYFQDLELPTIAPDKSVVYEPRQEKGEDLTSAICPVTGKTTSSTTVCPVSLGSISIPLDGTAAPNVCPVTGQHAAANNNASTEGNDKAQCPFSKSSFAEHLKFQDEKPNADKSGCPFSKDQQLELTNGAVCPVTGAMESVSLS